MIRGDGVRKIDDAKDCGSLSVGIDIGTTTISATVYDVKNGTQLESYCVFHDSCVVSDVFFEQSANIIIDKANCLLDKILDTYKGVASIGVTGQMHGIVYIDCDGKHVSNLINWQDKRADKVLDDGKSVCQRIYEITKENIYAGYGIATHYYNVLFGTVPKEAVGFVSIMDLFAMKICALKNVVIHASVASSFGLFDLKKFDFMMDKLDLLGIDRGFLPKVTEKSVIIGEYREIPVSIPIGDNQASFLGSVGENNSSLLVNIGTGAQISAVNDYFEAKGDIELRPFIEGRYLVCGSSLCGGFAYSMLEGFFRSYYVSCNMPNEPQYEIINRLALDAYERGEEGLCVDTTFMGKRSNPNLRGSIKNIGKESFTPANLALGVLKGICNELYELYNEFPIMHTRIVASGGAIKKNQLLKTLIGERFQMELSEASVNEEASVGAALFSHLAISKFE